ncbi:Uma2 family endonuclease [Sciscionella sediminilitoris]|uniref:Uma2 family endonuclease n=1 Tax=Sciscionella sediminilitoris TaxID=1445613 RepID=UPI0004DF313C|nr:Uma2 family endonuclease [Sciscionella sp. SE31]
MTAEPQPPEAFWPEHPLTAAEYAALGEEEHGRRELQEGAIVMSPSASSMHNFVGFELGSQLRPQLSRDRAIVLDVDVDLELAAKDRPGTVRRPDLVVVERSAVASGEMLRAEQVLIAVEIVSPSSVRLDHQMKRSEYADAGIPHYWIVELDERVTLTEHRLRGELGYRNGQSVTGTFRTEEPFPVTLELDTLRD